LVAYHLYDEYGALVAESELHDAPFGLAVYSGAGDLLLGMPAKAAGGGIQYRLYASNGRLLTSSDGVRTKIYPYLRMESVGRSWVPPA
jgi:hypothetical protein